MQPDCSWNAGMQLECSWQAVRKVAGEDMSPAYRQLKLFADAKFI